MKFLFCMAIKRQNMLDFVVQKLIRLGHLMHFESLVLWVRILLKCGTFHSIPIQIKYTLPLTQTSHIILKAGIYAPRVGPSSLRTVHGSLSKGFKLNYWFESIIHELGGFRQALFYLRDQLLADVRLVTRPTQIPVIKKKIVRIFKF